MRVRFPPHSVPGTPHLDCHIQRENCIHVTLEKVSEAFFLFWKTDLEHVPELETPRQTFVKLLSRTFEARLKKISHICHSNSKEFWEEKSDTNMIGCCCFILVASMLWSCSGPNSDPMPSPLFLDKDGNEGNQYIEHFKNCFHFICHFICHLICYFICHCICPHLSHFHPVSGCVQSQKFDSKSHFAGGSTVWSLRRRSAGKKTL